VRQLEGELADAKARIARLEVAGDAMAESYEEIETDAFGFERIEEWRKAKEAKPQVHAAKPQPCMYCMQSECDCSDFDVNPDMGAK